MDGHDDRRLDVLITAEELAVRVAEMARQTAEAIECRETIAVVALKGGLIFASDLVRHLPDLRALDFVQARSYGAQTAPSGEVRIVRDVETPVAGKDVLLIDDILDTGNTSATLLDHLRAQGARTVELVTLLDKPSRRQVPVEPLAVGFEVPDVFVVGYGMDFAERYRHLPYIASLEAGEDRAKT
ncbi:MAG: hypoxanthine phosphoribosyltransferase [Armatimonadia bacterium]|nr:hypoxanthine phosphoribosyltransferase [Armatimonadia bacterium]